MTAPLWTTPPRTPPLWTPPLWTAAELQAATGGAMPVPFDATGISIDTRTLRPGDLFVALHGDTDGHAHAEAALARGAAGVLVHRIGGLAAGAPWLLVGDTLAALTALGLAARARFGGRLVAVTGSVGKTTTKEMLRTVLAAFGPTHAAPASYNNHWGVPLTLARIPPGAAFCVVEIGMNNAGEILPLARLSAPHVAVVTSVGSAHIGHLGSLDAIATEKASLQGGLVAGGISVLPTEGPGTGLLSEAAPGRVIGFGPNGDVRLRTLDLGPESSAVTADVRGTEIGFVLGAPGAHMASNALATLAACAALDLDPAKAAAALEAFEPFDGRGRQSRIAGGAAVLLDESYNASAPAVRAALAVLHRVPATRHLVVLGDMLELGRFAEAEHAGLAADVVATADRLFTCGPHSRALFDRVPAALRGAHATDSAALAPLVAAAVRPGDAVLVKGSLGSRMRVVVDALHQLGSAQSVASTPSAGAV